MLIRKRNLERVFLFGGESYKTIERRTSEQGSRVNSLSYPRSRKQLVASIVRTSYRSCD